MRLLETILLCLNLLLFAGIFFIKRSLLNVIWLAISIFLGVIMLEGVRWQMYPAYLITVTLCTICLLRKRIVKTFDNRLVKVAMTVVFGLALLVSTVLPILIPVFRFPNPGGPHEIGTVTYHWIDSSRRELFDPSGTWRRELMVQIWYPAKKGNPGVNAVYLPDAKNISKAMAGLQRKFPAFFLRHLKYVNTHSKAFVPVAIDQSSYPVLLFLEGLTGYRQMNTFQAEELVSHGYIVVAIDQPGVASAVVFPDKHQILSPGRELDDRHIPYFANDVTFVSERLATVNDFDRKDLLFQKMDLSHTGIFGVSYGGIVAAKASLKNPRIKACLVMEAYMTDDVVNDGLGQPAMWITRDATSMRSERKHSGGWTEADINEHQTTMRRAYNNVHSDAYFVQIPGMFHIDLTDLNALSPTLPYIGFSGPMGRRRAHYLINKFSLAFFNQHLKNLREPLQEILSNPYPDAQIENQRHQ